MVMGDCAGLEILLNLQKFEIRGYHVCDVMICRHKMIQFIPENHYILIHSDATRFQNVFITLLRNVAKEVTSSLLSWHKRNDFNAANFRHHS